MKRHAFVTLMVVLLISGGVRTETELLFVNGRILTMDADNSVVEAMWVVGGRIRGLGSQASLANKIASSTTVDLHGRTMLPGFVDAHSHFPASGIRAISVDLSPPPIGNTDSHTVLLSQLQRASKASGSGDDWLLGYNYDNTAFSDGEHPTREQLDAVVPGRPVYLWHNSGHMGVANSKALALLSIDETSIAVPGGVLGRDKRSGKLNGLLQEKAAPPLASIIGKYPLLTQLKILTSARDEYLAAGVTTVQNGYAGKNMMHVLRLSQAVGLVSQRIVVWPAHGKKNGNHKLSTRESGHFKFSVGAIKILVDGSPQGMTAYLSEPYYDTRDRPTNYRGFALFDQVELVRLVAQYHKAGYQLALHGNGDAAIESIINAVETAQSVHPRPDARHIIVHAQTLRKDQVARLTKLSLSPSFFTSHTFFWGDWHRQYSLGPMRAHQISPARWTQDAGVRFSLHSDTPVTPISPQQLLWSATQRRTQTGFELGPEQRIDMLAALRAITIDAAWQNHLEDAVGSLEVGKFADFVVLSDNPLDAEDVRDIQVLSTYINGVKRYERTTQ